MREYEFHGMASMVNGRVSPEYRTWNAMTQRCTNEKHSKWDRYGGRGIRVCMRWRNSFNAFYSDMGSKPEGWTIDRIDNDGDYEPGNCRWAPRATQCRNQSVTPRSPFGIAGVTYWYGAYCVAITVNNNKKYLGRFQDFFEACCARKSAENKYWSRP